MRLARLLVIVLVSAAFCQAPSETRFGLEAHRGLCNRFPENSIPAFREAGKSRAYSGMETDVQMSADGVLVCMHDDTIDRTVNAHGRISEYTYRELRKMRLSGGRGWNDNYLGKLRIPTFRQYLKICRKYGLIPYVELKCLSEEGVRKTIQTLDAMGFKGKYVLTSFNLESLDQASKYTTAHKEYMCTDYTNSDVDCCFERGYVVRADASRLTPELAAYAKSKGLILECFGIPVSGAEVVERLVSLGVSGGTCDDYEGLGL